MLLSVCLPHSGRDEVDDIETVRNVMTEGRVVGAVDFYIGGDINVDVSLGDADEALQGLDSIVWYGMYAPECKGGGEDVITYGKMRLLQLLKEFLCTVTSTWTNKDDKCEHRTWRAWGSRVRRKQFHCVMGPRDLTWFLDHVRLRIWDRFLVVGKIEGKDLRAKKGVKGWANTSFKNLCFARTKAVPRRAKMGMMDWPLCRKDWKKRRLRSRLLRRLCG